MQVLFQIVRQAASAAPHLQTYALDVDPSRTILDCLNQIKWEQDGTLGFRKNCRNTICGSCSVRINGRSALACKENVGGELARLSEIASQSLAEPAPDGISTIVPTITVAPMGNMPVIKDLIVDMKSFWDNLDAVDPFVSTSARRVPEREFLQTPAEREQLNQVGNCILCGACYSECNARESDPSFVGPHALAKAYRMTVDSRDDQTEQRLEQYGQGTAGVWGCTRCYYCNSVCPMDVAPMEQISKIKQAILARQAEQTPAQSSRPVRHRKVLIELVKQGGWIDERQFGLKVVGNSFRDWKGLASLGPLGVRMLQKGKFPTHFKPSEGAAQVHRLIDAVRQAEAER